MLKHNKLLIALACGSSAALLLFVLFRSQKPSYHGRTLSSWLHICSHTTIQNDRDEARQAVIHIGSNAIPYLLKSIRYTPPPWKKLTTTQLQKLRRFSLARAIIPNFLAIDGEADRAESTVVGFRILGPAAASAFPELARLACDATHQERSERAIRTLILVRPHATTALGEVLSDAPGPTRLKTLQFIAVLHDRSLLRALLPSLLERMYDTDDEVAKWAVVNVTELKLDQPEPILTVLVEALKIPKPQVRAELIKSIATFDTAATPAVPSLTQFLTDTDPIVRRETTNLLRMIAPAVLRQTPSP
jgi:HEAT repeat protein